MKSLKSLLVIGTLAIGLPLGTASVAMAEVAKPAKPHTVSLAALAVGATPDEAMRGALKGANEGLADHEKRTGSKCKVLNNSVSVEKKDDHFLSIAELTASCRKR